MGAGYDLLLGLHVLVALIGFGSILLTGLYAGIARSRRPVPEPACRFFGPGRNWASRAIFLVPVFGAALVGASGGDITFAQAWVAASLGLWVAAVGVVHASVWPAEHRVQELLARPSLAAAGSPGDRADGQTDPKELSEEEDRELAALCRRLLAATAVVDAIALVAVVLMFAKPGG